MHPPRFGAGFRSRHFEEIAGAPRAVDWFEVVSDNFIALGGPRRDMLARLRADHPIILHGVSLSIAGTGPLPGRYLRGLKALADWVEPAWVSDHLCWTSLGGRESHDLLPVAYTRDVLDHVAARVARVQDLLGRRLLLENASTYVAFCDDEMDEAEFFAALARRTGCGMLLDVNNLCVNAANLGIDPIRYLAGLPPGIVGYIHLAGHAMLPDVRIDTHDQDVPPPVWSLFDAAVRRFPEAGVIVERDDNLPPFARLVEEVRQARERQAAALGAPAAGVSPAPPARPPARARAPRPWHALQRGFWKRLVDKPVGFDHRPDGTLGRLLDDGRPVVAGRGMRVYSDSYTANLRRALAVNFPALARVITDEDLDRLAAAYLRRHPPRGHDFQRLGRHLAAFVRSYPFAGDYGVDPAVLEALIALEQAQLEVQDAADEAAAVSPAVLATLTALEWEDARFVFARALRVVHATHDVLTVVDAVARGAPPRRPAAGRVAYLVCRAGGELRTERLGAAEATILQALVGGSTFARACAAAAPGGDGSEVATLGARLLVDACARGLVVRMRRSSKRPRLTRAPRAA